MKNLKYLLRKRSNTYTKADLIHLISKFFKLSLINLTLSSQLPVTKNQIKEKKPTKKFSNFVIILLISKRILAI